MDGFRGIRAKNKVSKTNSSQHEAEPMRPHNTDRLTTGSGRDEENIQALSGRSGVLESTGHGTFSVNRDRTPVGSPGT